MQNCDIIVSEFELQSRYDVHFWTNTPGKGIDSCIPTAMGLIVSPLIYKDDFGIK